MNQPSAQLEGVQQTAAEAFRDYVLAQPAYSSTDVADRLGSANTANRSAPAKVLREQRKLWGIWNGRTFVHPAFQFRRDGRVDPRIAELLAQLPVADPEADRDGWERALWFYAPHSLLDGATPAERWPSDPEAVLAAARTQFGTAHAHAHW